MYGSNCRAAEREGVSVLHGNRGVYHDEKQPTFKALYEAIRDVSVFSPPIQQTCTYQHEAVQALWSPVPLKAK